MDIKTIIVDDEEDARELLKIFLSDDVDVILVAECKNGKEAIEAIRTQAPSIVLLDIQMPGINGLEVIEKLTPPYPYIIFVTAFDEYAIEAFELNAIDYVLKPYSEERIRQALKKAKNRVKDNDFKQLSKQYEAILEALKSDAPSENREGYFQRISVKSPKRTLFIDVPDIIILEASDQYIEVHTLEGKFIVRDSIDHLEQALDPHIFFRTHRSCIVNLSEVKALESSGSKTSMVILKNGMKVRLSSTRKSQFKKAMRL
ncbi:MAG: LytTR family DNA-binding domain-containing protein [Bacteroidota bacterium]